MSYGYTSGYYDGFKRMMQDKLGISTYSLSDDELDEVFTLPSYKAAAEAVPGLAKKDLATMQLKGDANLDSVILDILDKRNFRGSYHNEKVRLVGNDKEQPLNKLYEEWKLDRFVQAIEISLSMHQKADVVEAIFGLLHHKKLLTVELIEKAFGPYLPPKQEAMSAEAAKPKLTAPDLAKLDSRALEVTIKRHNDTVRLLADDIIKVIINKIVDTACGDIDTWVERLFLIAKTYDKSLTSNLLNDDRISLEKFQKMVPHVGNIHMSDFALDNLSKFPSRFLKLRMRCYLNDDSNKTLTKAWMQKLNTANAEESKALLNALNKIIPDLKAYEFLITAYHELSEDKKALLPANLKALEHLVRFVKTTDCYDGSKRESYVMDQTMIKELLDLPSDTIKTCLSLLDKSGPLAGSIKAEIEKRMRDPKMTEKARAKYTSYLACLDEVKPKTALPLSSAMGGAGAATSSPAPY
ncbi:MAG: hypothetical protein K0R66_841 [Gammaproteobacteria bacterium]|jgi:hypothetical protein|nr:hypothetical protein [Gammaproteobacteria bacterium]